MKKGQLQESIEAFQKQLLQTLPSLIEKVTIDIGQSLYFKGLFKLTSPKTVQDLYSQSLLRLEPHISRQQPDLEKLIICVNELIHQYFMERRDYLLELILVEKELRQEPNQSTMEMEEKEIEIEISREEMCKLIKTKYLKEVIEPSCEKCLCNNQYTFKQVIQCLLCENYFHTACLEKSYQLRNYTCPRCALANMDQFCPVQQIILNPFPFKKSGLVNSKTVKFKVDTDLIDIRCLRLDCPQNAEEITWPDLGELQLNNKKILEFKPLNQNSSQKKRKDEKITCSIKNNEECSLQIRETVPNMDQKKNLKIINDQLHYVAVYQTKQYHLIIEEISYMKELQKQQIIHVYLLKQNQIKIEQFNWNNYVIPLMNQEKQLTQNNQHIYIIVQQLVQ